MAAANGSVGQQQPTADVIKILRKRTRDVHKVSDLLVNAKFAFALSDDSVWADGLLCFYEVYKYLEENLPEKLCPKELHRTEAFERDLAYFLGDDWKQNYEPRESVKKYLKHMEAVREKNPVLLLAYVYQMYTALMSGGQLLQKKRMIARKLWIGKKDEDFDESQANAEDDDAVDRPFPKQVTMSPAGCNATYFPGKIFELKAKVRAIVNRNYANADEAELEEFIEENRQVFLYNNEVVRSIKGVNRVGLRKLATVVVIVLGVYFAIKLVRH